MDRIAVHRKKMSKGNGKAVQRKFNEKEKNTVCLMWPCVKSTKGTLFYKVFESCKVFSFESSWWPRILCLGSSLGSYLGCRKGHSRIMARAQEAPASPRACLGLGLYPPCTLPSSLQTSAEKDSVCLHRVHNPQIGTAEGLKTHSPTQQPKQPDQKESPQFSPPTSLASEKSPNGSRGQGGRCT